MLKKILTALTMVLFSLAFSQQSGKATFYHDKYNGRKAADGSIFNQSGLTCASTTYKLGSMLRITNQENGKEVIVKVTDNGNFRFPKLVDLSKTAFSQIASLKQGIIKVLVEEVN